jgi:hypothetical protein
MAVATLTYTQTLVVESCPTCHIEHGIPDDLRDRALAKPGPNGLAIYCPAGHRWWFTGKTEEQKLRERLAQRDEDLARERARRDQAEADAEHERNRVRGYQGALGKAKKRAARGVCPAPGCKRSFVDVAKHVATCHPDLAAADA